MAFSLTPDLKTMRCASGEPIFFAYQPASAAGVPEDLTDRAFVFVIYDRFTGQEIKYFEGEVRASDVDPAAYWTLSGLISAELAGQAGLAFELSERLDDGRDVLASGTFLIDASAPRVLDNPLATLSRYITRITRMNDPTNLLMAKFVLRVILYVPPAPTISAFAMSLDGTDATVLTLDGTTATILELA